MKASKYILSLLSIFIALSNYAQMPMLSNQGVLLSVKDNAFMAVHGNVLNSNNGEFHNSETIHLFGDWENNADNEAFISSGEGIVTMRGNNQTISGNDITRFYELRLENIGTKFGRNIDIYVDGFLILNDRELNMDSNVVHVFNPDAQNAIQSGLNNNFGFISAVENGGLVRLTDSQSEYPFYVGSTNGVNRFRPIHVQPADATLNAYRVRLANTDPNNENYDRTFKDFEICDINPFFYHRMARTEGNSAANLKFFIDNNSEGNYNALTNWSLLAWREKSSATSTGNLYGLNQLNIDSLVYDFSNFPFALANSSPAIELIAPLSPFCSNESLELEASGNFTSFNFFIDSLLEQSGTTTFYSGQISTGQYPVWVSGINANCGRTSDTVWIQVLQSPTVAVSADTIIVEGSSATLYATGADFYDWTPASDLSCNVCPFTNANPLQTTIYSVRAENIDGCIDTASVTVEVKSDVGQVLFIPNVITPNNDGYNDSWRIENIQLFPSNRVLIVNRWGDIVYQSDFYNNDWDGSFGGGLLPSGTYYYILDLGQGWGIFKGDVTIIRK